MTVPSGSPVTLGFTLPVGAAIRLSPAAAAALVYTPGATSASLITGLTSTPSVHTITAPGTIAESAVSDTGSVSFAYAQSSSFAIGVAAVDGRSTPIASVKAIGGLNFLPGRATISSLPTPRPTHLPWFAPPLPRLRQPSSRPRSFLRVPPPWPSPAVGVGHSSRIPVARALSGLTSPHSTTTAISCACKPTLAATLADDGAFRVTDALTGPNWIVDAAASTPRTLFIPAPSGPRPRLPWSHRWLRHEV